jgi:hypothetical protein
VPQKLGSCWGLPNNFVYWNLNLQKNIDVVLVQWSDIIEHKQNFLVQYHILTEIVIILRNFE